jgi:hypothetical protein
MLVFHYLKERFPRRSDRSPSRRGTHHHHVILADVRYTARGTILIFPAPDRGTTAILSAVFGVDAGRIRPCTQCRGFFLVPMRSINQRQCWTCAGLAQQKPLRGVFLGPFTAPWKQLRRRLAKQVERDTLTRTTMETFLDKALQEARQELRRGASPNAWQARWKAKTRQPMGRPRKSPRRESGEEKDLRAG